MTIIKLLFLKFIFSLFVCFSSSITIFFIFSLLGNLNENYLFKTIINLSLLNSLQILAYVPSFIFLISIILFTVFLRSKNEIIIIKSYLNIKKFMFFFLPIVLIFTVFEINKNDFALFLEDSKNILLKKTDKPTSKILISKTKNLKTITVLNANNFESSEGFEYRLYKILDKKIYEAQYSKNLLIYNNTLIARNYSQYKNDLIQDYNTEKTIDINLIDLIKQNTIVKDISKKNNFEINFKLINLFTFFVLFFSFIFLIFSNKKFVNTKEGLIYPAFVCVIFFIYSFLIFNNSLNFYKQEIEILASMIIGLLVLKEVINE